MPAASRCSARPRSCGGWSSASACTPAQAIYVGDELRDGEAARAAGIAFAAVAWGYSAPEALQAQAPDRFFTCVAEIAPALA